eukprot:TRINITY_DN512_c2_g1_i1.p1 TRINITY_DN512_c2_g1~~TRINITY_DN512_c2_g1_i1.p1  ORF type:complete len:145 (+),score=13.07 TRINITY_DN512_c2_g1_i1:98-532(+)
MGCNASQNFEPDRAAKATPRTRVTAEGCEHELSDTPSLEKVRYCTLLKSLSDTSVSEHVLTLGKASFQHSLTQPVTEPRAARVEQDGYDFAPVMQKVLTEPPPPIIRTKSFPIHRCASGCNRRVTFGAMEIREYRVQMSRSQSF